MIAHPASGQAGAIGSEADYAGALERESGGVFRGLLAKRDPAAAIEAYPKLFAAYVSIEDTLFDAYSPHANRFPAWYAQRLVEMGLGELGEAQVAFFENELESGNFDRVVHAYYVLSRNELPLVRAEAPTPLWKKMISVARNDPENRYWISLALAESKMLPARVYDRLHTRMATGTESVRERFSPNADGLGARIVRVLGIGDGDPRVAHLRIRYALDAAEQRVRDHQLIALGADGAYRSIVGELDAMEKGTEEGGFESRRFLALMQNDLPLLLETFGPPPDPGALVETLAVLCRGPGSNRMLLWAAADSLKAAYAPWLAAAEKPPPEPLPSAETIFAGSDDAEKALDAILRDATRPERVVHLFESDAIPRVVAKQPPRDPRGLRGAIRDAYYRLGYPPAHRAAYQRALDSLGPEELAHDEATRAELEALARRFSGARTAEAFGRVFDEYRQDRSAGRVPSRDVEGSFVSAFSAAAVRILESESEKIAAASRRAEEAREARRQASAAIEEAEAAVVDANRLIRVANEAVAREEVRQGAALEARNDAVSRLNEAVERANAARVAGKQELEAARAEARRLERELSDLIASREAEVAEAGAALEAAEQSAVDQLNRARREQARARARAETENESVEAERAAVTEAERSRSRFSEVLGRLVAGLGFVGIRGDPEAIGDAGQAASVRLASVAMLLESDVEIPGEVADAVERERGGGSSLGRLAALASARVRAQAR